MKEVIFVTHNKGKIESAKKHLKEVNFKTYEYELEEPRSDDIKYISKYKVEEAYKLVHKPCISLDCGFWIDELKGFPRAFVTSSQIQKAIQSSINSIVEVIKMTLEKTPPELASDIIEKGIILAGGGALIKNLDKLLSEKTKMPVYIAESPLDCVVKGTGKTLEDLERLKHVLINARKR